jgi:3-dehydroquinate dehydratase type I
MNKGKICVSVCAKTAEETTEKINRAKEFADVIELRLDCIEGKQILKTFAFLNLKRPLLLTFRPMKQGGKAPDDLFGRAIFWNVVIRGLPIDASEYWFDHEYDLGNLEPGANSVTLRSFHDFSGTPENLEEIFDRLSGNSNVVKIAVQAGDITDSIAVWKLLDKARAEKKEIIPIARQGIKRENPGFRHRGRQHKLFDVALYSQPGI